MSLTNRPKGDDSGGVRENAPPWYTEDEKRQASQG